ncbi:hypothetical protein [Tolypothrix sp. VBCCA 56010]|uniref:hypothetical protein n=1 Tax=Tolypothrix sp. VBCCA 56010 TaxID=3137731 RepID=UPI003D7DF414
MDIQLGIGGNFCGYTEVERERGRGGEGDKGTRGQGGQGGNLLFSSHLLPIPHYAFPITHSPFPIPSNSTVLLIGFLRGFHV